MSYDHGQPIEEWTEKLSKEDRAAVLALVGVRTVGDLLVVLDRGEVEKELAKRLARRMPQSDDWPMGR